MAKLGLVGPTYQSRSLPFDAQRTINLYPIMDETHEGKEISALQGTPGLSLFATSGIGPIRGEFSSTNGRAFVVSNTQLYEVSIAGVSTLRGTLTTDVTIVTMDENTTQLAICDGTSLYIFTYATNVFVTVSLPFSPALTVTEIDSYFIINTTAGQFYKSALADGTTWSALDFATAESSPDGLIRVFASVGQLWLFGSRTTEVWYDSGDLDFPFALIQGAKMEVGCASAFTVLSLDNTIFWLGQNQYGQGIVYRANGYTPLRISTFAIEYMLNKSSDLSQIRSYTYQEEGHEFYLMTGGNLATSPGYDVATQEWHERAYLELDGSFTTHKATTCMFAFSKHLVGDKTNGNIYDMSLNYYDDAGRPIKSQRTFTHINNEGHSFGIKRLQVDFEYGVGLNSGQGSDPVVWLRQSIDGAKTFGPELKGNIGKLGAYKTRNEWRRLGQTDNQMTFQVSITDPVRRSICGAYAD